jgi:hypothetical protein
MCGKCLVLERNAGSQTAAPRPHVNAIQIWEEKLRQRRQRQQQTSAYIPGVSDAAFCSVIKAIQSEELKESETVPPVPCNYCHRLFIAEKLFVHHRLCTADNPMNPLESVPLEKRTKKARENKLMIERGDVTIQSTAVEVSDSLLLLDSFHR